VNASISNASITTGSFTNVKVNNETVDSSNITTLLCTNGSVVNLSSVSASLQYCNVWEDSVVGGSLTVTGNIYGNHGYFTDYITVGYSDYNLKNKIEDLTDCVKKMTGLSTYLYKPYEWACEKYGILPRERYGLSAQEVQQVFPTAVTRAVFDDAYLSLDYDMLIPVLVRCIQELDQRLSEVELH